MEESSEQRLHLADEPETKLEDDPARPKKMRLIFTLVMPQAEVMSDPLVHRARIVDIIKKINDEIKPERVGVVAVEEDADGKSV